MLEEPAKIFYHEYYLPKYLLLSAPATVSVPVAPRRAVGSFILVATVMLLSLLGLWPQLSRQARAIDPFEAGASRTSNLMADSLRRDLDGLQPKIKQIEDSQATNGLNVVDDQKLQASNSSIQIDTDAGNYHEARIELARLKQDLDVWQRKLNSAIFVKKNELALKNQPTGPVPDAVTAPILIYHYPPPDFEKQLQYLQQHGYTSVSLDQLAAALTNGVQLPPKPVVITFDDGFSNQMSAFELLKKYQMKATYYIIDAGVASKYCIGAGRRYDQGYNCGDGYLNWDQVRELDQSGLITIASHTVDHLSLSNQSPEVQKFEIIEGKRQLEAQLGHPVLHFAYPYGSYNATTQAIVREAGFVTAVSTLPGTIHTRDTLFSLHRVRSALKLP